MASTVGIRSLRSDLAAAVRRASSGEQLVVTVGGRPVAQLGPVQDTAGQVRLDDLVAAGWIVPPRRHGPYRPSAAVPVWAGTRLDRVLREIR